MIFRLSLICWLIIVLGTSPIYSQCFPDRHNTSVNSAWISCTSSINPNIKRGDGHWILYELEEMSTINNVNLWNLNHPDYLDSGAKSIAIDYVDFNGNWKEHGIYSIENATGSAFYQGESLSLENDIVSEKILITILDNFGGNCFGFSEVRFELRRMITATEDVKKEHFNITVMPNPFTDFTTIEIDGLEGSSLDYQVVNSLGQVVLTDRSKVGSGRARFVLNAVGFPSGDYFLKIINGPKVSFKKLSHLIK